MTQNSNVLELHLVKIPSGFVPPIDFLQQAQQSKAKRFSGKRLVEFSVARLLLSYGLGPDWLLEERDNGAPVALSKIDQSQRLLSVSHSSSWVAVAIAPPNDSLIFGIDIEKTRSGWNKRKAQFFCNEQQTDAGLTLSSTARQDYFFTALWTQKEAYFKATQMPFVDRGFDDDSRMQTTVLEDEMVLSVYSDPTSLAVIKQNTMIIDVTGVSFSPKD